VARPFCQSAGQIIRRAEAAVSGETRNEMSGIDRGVQAGVVQGGVHFHGAAAPPVPRQLPGAARHFVDRSVEQDVLTTVLNGMGADGSVLLSTIDGTAGVGKSTLAVHWARQHRDSFPDGDLYVNLRGFDPVAEPMQPAEALGTFLTALGVPAERIPADLEARAAQFRSAVHGKRVLVLLDNARSTEQVRPLLPGSDTGLVLVTSRDRLDVLVTLEGAERVSLDLLTAEKARELMTRYLGEERAGAEPGALEEVLERCAGLPLALGIVAVRAAHSRERPLSELVAELRDEQARLDALEAGGISGVRAVFSWSYRSLSEGAARLFRLMGLPTGPDLSASAVAALGGLDVAEAREFLDELTRTNLVDQSGKDRYAFHDLLRAYAAECANADEPQDDREMALRRLFDFYLRTSYAAEQQMIPHAPRMPLQMPPATVPGLWFNEDETALQWWEDERRNLLAAARQSFTTGFPVHTWQIPYTLMYFFHLRGYTDDWIASYQLALEAADWLSERSVRAALLYDLGIARSDRKDYQGSARDAEKAASLYREFGDQDGECPALTNLGNALIDAGCAKDAGQHLDRALELSSALDSPYYRGQVLHAIGRRYAHLGLLDEALQSFATALEIDREIGEKFGEGWVLHHMADALFAGGQLTEAAEAYRKAADFRGEIGHRQGKARSLRSLAVALRAKDAPEEAREALQQAVVAFEELGDPEAEEIRTELERSE
jgi:tetratricopeptide (TPR) repeat protein